MDYQILVNKKNKITKQIVNNANLITIKDYLNQEILIEKKTYQMYLKLREVLLSEKIEMAITSAYRSIQEQEKLLEEFQNQYGNDYIKHYVALPGYSEHHTGLCLDLTFKNNGQYLETNEEDEFTYTSLNTNIASVSEEGKIEGIALGKTRVNAVSKNLGKTYSVLVNVIENEHTVSPMIVGGDEFAGVLRADRKIMGIWI